MSNLIPFDPFAEIHALQKQLLGEDWFSPSKSSMQLPATDVYTKDDKEMIVEAHLGNFEDKDVDVHLENGALIISAEKHEREEDKSKKYVLRESSSSFYRRLRLPERALSDKTEAHMENGVLKVTIPLKELPKPKKVQIKSGKK